jgi:hypothetical protein
MPNTYESIATQTLGASAASVTFSSIPATYTDLVLIHAGTTDANRDISIRFNGDSGSNYSRTLLFGDGSSAGSGRDSNSTLINFNFQNTTESTCVAQIMNYSNTTTNKTLLSRENPVSTAAAAIVGLWRDTSAITSITIAPGAGTLSSGSTFTLYGIKSA